MKITCSAVLTGLLLLSVTLRASLGVEHNVADLSLFSLTKDFSHFAWGAAIAWSISKGDKTLWWSAWGAGAFELAMFCANFVVINKWSIFSR